MADKESLQERMARLEEGCPLRHEFIDKEIKEINKKMDAVTGSNKGINDFLHNGFTGKIEEKVNQVLQEEVSKFTVPSIDNSEVKKNVVIKVWQSDNFWKYLHRVTYMILWILASLLGVDILAGGGAILKALGIVP